MPPKRGLSGSEGGDEDSSTLDSARKKKKMDAAQQMQVSWWDNQRNTVYRNYRGYLDYKYKGAASQHRHLDPLG